MALDREELSTFCDALSDTLMLHIMLLLAYLSEKDVYHAHWLKEIKSYLKELSLKTSFKSKSRDVRVWVAKSKWVDIYEDAAVRMKGKVQDLPLEILLDTANSVLDTMAEHISKNNNPKRDDQELPHSCNSRVAWHRTSLAYMQH